MSLSLRSFHLVFIAASIALAAWVGVWGIASWRAGEGASGLALAALFLGFGALLVVYFVRVRRKFREMGPED
jgi:hypothetical protein